MKASIMQGIEALVLSRHDLSELMIKTSELAAIRVLEQFRRDLNVLPEERVVQQLREYIQDRSTISSPREHWAHSRHIRMLMPAKSGKPKSVSWFQKFKKVSTLGECQSRPSSDHGRLREWCFEDIANAWDHRRTNLL